MSRIHFEPTLVEKNVLQKRFGIEAVTDRLTNDNPSNFVALQKQLNYESQKPPVLDKVGPCSLPPGWKFEDKITYSPESGHKVRTKLTSPDGASGKVSFLFKNDTLSLKKEYRSSLPAKLDDIPGFKEPIPTIPFLSVRAIKLLGVNEQNLKFFSVNQLQHPLTIAHLDWLRRKYPEKSLSQLMGFTGWAKRMNILLGLVGYRLLPNPELRLQGSSSWRRVHPTALIRDWDYPILESERLAVQHATGQPIPKVDDTSQNWRLVAKKAIKGFLSKITNTTVREKVEMALQGRLTSIRTEKGQLESRYEMQPKEHPPELNFDVIYTAVPKIPVVH